VEEAQVIRQRLAEAVRRDIVVAPAEPRADAIGPPPHVRHHPAAQHDPQARRNAKTPPRRDGVFMRSGRIAAIS
jgi:hypothetical protein